MQRSFEMIILIRCEIGLSMPVCNWFLESCLKYRYQHGSHWTYFKVVSVWLTFKTAIDMMLSSLLLFMNRNIFVIMIIATITTSSAAILPSLVTGSMNLVMAQGHIWPEEMPRQEMPRRRLWRKQKVYLPQVKMDVCLTAR